jgi:GT2 family glycosyltransferase
MTPVLSLVTGSYNRPESLQRLIASIVQHTRVDWELVVSDASDDLFTASEPNVRVFAERPRLGCTLGFNKAFKAALGEWVIWLNDDAEVCADYDVEAIRFMTARPEIGLGALHYSERGGPFHVNSAWGAIYANFGILRREVGERVGWFDGSLNMYGCDNSLALRVLMAGFGVEDIPGARVIHHSVEDQARMDNQRLRARDNHVLQDAYMPYRGEWLSVFRRHYRGSFMPWPHGRRPVRV